MSTSSQALAGPHLVRYGTAADQKYLLNEFLDTYDQLVINANMVAHMPGALASFLATRAQNKPYFIDPQTHAFQQDISHLESQSETKAGELKRSIATLIEAYGEPVVTCVGKNHNSVLPEDFAHAKRRRDFCRRVIEFQTDTLATYAEKGDAAKYYDYLKKQGRTTSDHFAPTLAVAPYFYLTPNTLKDWLPVNIACARDSVVAAQAAGIPLALQVVIARDVLTTTALHTHLLKEYKAVPPALFLLWVDDFAETGASEDELTAFVGLISELANVAPVVNLYGGYFSILLSRMGRLAGVTHGLEYGEDRGVVPIGGGIPTAKFYFPMLHARLPFRDALRAARALEGMRSADDYYSKVCDCEQCRSLIGKVPEEGFYRYGQTRPVSFFRRNQPVVMEYPLPETKDACTRHYMWCKEKEFREPGAPGDTLPALLASRKSLQRSLGLDGVAHCGAWHDVLSRYLGSSPAQ